MPISHDLLREIEARAVAMLEWCHTPMPELDPEIASRESVVAIDLLTMVDAYGEKERQAKGVRPCVRARFAEGLHGKMSLRLPAKLPAEATACILPIVIVVGWGELKITPVWQCLDSGIWGHASAAKEMAHCLDLGATDDSWTKTPAPGESIQMRLRGAYVLKPQVRIPRVCPDRLCKAPFPNDETPSKAHEMDHGERCRIAKDAPLPQRRIPQCRLELQIK